MTVRCVRQQSATVALHKPERVQATLVGQLHVKVRNSSSHAWRRGSYVEDFQEGCSRFGSGLRAPLGRSLIFLGEGG